MFILKLFFLYKYNNDDIKNLILIFYCPIMIDISKRSLKPFSRSAGSHESSSDHDSRRSPGSPGSRS